LDLKLRQHMRGELKALQRKTGVTFVYITHDQGEALAMSDRIAVMNQGRVEQVGSADAIYDRPATPFVATFVGENNLIRGIVAEAGAEACTIDTPLGRLTGRNADGLAAGADAMLFVRPERLRLIEDGADAEPNALAATVVRRDLEGAFAHLHLRAGDHPLVVHQTNSGRPEGIPQGACRVGFDVADAVVMRSGALSHD
jgi:spermidine/putrescine transport system ATP-binding protein